MNKRKGAIRSELYLYFYKKVYIFREAIFIAYAFLFGALHADFNDHLFWVDLDYSAYNPTTCHIANINEIIIAVEEGIRFLLHLTFRDLGTWSRLHRMQNLFKL